MKKLIVITCILCITVCGLFPKKELEKKKTEFCLFGGMTSTQLNFSLSPSSPAEESDSLSAGTLNTSIETLPTHSAASSFFVGGGV
ncbi:MAG: hypothetical protein GY757_32375, partial [bacterium]|nr:hypothetical protein [bacterium]